MNKSRIAISALCLAFLALGLAIVAFVRANQNPVAELMNDSLAIMEKYKDWNPFDPSKRLDKARTELTNAQSSAARLHPLGDAGMACVDLEKLDDAREYADKLLKLSESIYPGKGDPDAVHRGNIILGRIELRKNNIENAKSFLLKAGRVESSPVLGSFGPNMVLAKEMLEKNEREVVLEYFKLCEAFWTHDIRSSLKRWTDQVKAGKVPNFQGNLLY